MTTLAQLRRFAVARSLFAPTTLARALDRLGFVQADPIRAPARAQDLILRHRVTGYRAGDLERLYPTLDVDEDVFLAYGFVSRSLQALMHPRTTRGVFAERGVRWSRAGKTQAERLLEFIRERGAVHPREVVAHFSPRSVRNYWGGSSNATTILLAGMHYRGMLRIQRRDAGIRVYAPQQHGEEPANAEEIRARVDALARAAIGLYAPVTAKGLTQLVRRLRYAAPQWRTELKGAVQRAKDGHAHARIDGVEWYWPADEHPDHQR
ncbi:MAG: DNA glycosylase AlkZ-like family protein, partial [Gemmatimonadaceae bacterium]